MHIYITYYWYTILYMDLSIHGFSCLKGPGINPSWRLKDSYKRKLDKSCVISFHFLCYLLKTSIMTNLFCKTFRTGFVFLLHGAKCWGWTKGNPFVVGTSISISLDINLIISFPYILYIYYKVIGGEGDDRGWDGWMASLTQWTWIWASSGS